MTKSFATITIVAVALSLSATIAQAGSGRSVIPPSQQNFRAKPESADAVVPGSGRGVVWPGSRTPERTRAARHVPAVDQG